MAGNFMVRDWIKNSQEYDIIQVIVKNETLSKERRQNGAGLIQKNKPCEIPERGSEAAFQRVNEFDPMICARRQGEMRIIAFIEDEHVIKKRMKTRITA